MTMLESQTCSQGPAIQPKKVILCPLLILNKARLLVLLAACSTNSNVHLVIDLVTDHLPLECLKRSHAKTAKNFTKKGFRLKEKIELWKILG